MKDIKINWINTLIWLILIPAMSALSWYGVYKLIQWLF
jgi:hypothetical protein